METHTGELSAAQCREVPSPTGNLKVASSLWQKSLFVHKFVLLLGKLLLAGGQVEKDM